MTREDRLMKNNQRRQRETHGDRGGLTVGQEGREEETVIHGDRRKRQNCNEGKRKKAILVHFSFTVDPFYYFIYLKALWT